MSLTDRTARPTPDPVPASRALEDVAQGQLVVGEQLPRQAAGILEWPALPRIEAITATLRSVADFYRVKFAGKPAESTQSTIAATERAITTFATGKTPRTKTGKTIIDAYDARLQLTGNPVTDWQLARSRLRGSNELAEVFGKARLLRLLHATDSLAWGLNDIWDGTGAYPAAAERRAPHSR
ncbi:hypothetical protein ABT256_15880 [Amycolatopsis japonica]|uniref:hypothetical protein n=1 Tax=Amycolatopsis japonica TaxID=208439 RepID=UPI0033302847